MSMYIYIYDYIYTTIHNYIIMILEAHNQLSHNQYCVENYPKIYQLQTINIYYLTVSVSQAFRYGLAGSSTSGYLIQRPLKYGQRLQCFLRLGLDWEGCTCKVTHLFRCQDSFLTGCCTETSVSQMLAEGLRQQFLAM